MNNDLMKITGCEHSAVGGNEKLKETVTMTGGKRMFTSS